MKLSQDRVTLLDFILAVRKVKFDHPFVDGMSVMPITRQRIANPNKPFEALPPHIQVAIETAELALAAQPEEAAIAFRYFMMDHYHHPEEALTHVLNPYSVARQRWLTLEELRMLIDRLKLNEFEGKVFSKI